MIAVHQVQPAPPVTAAWVQRLLQPVAEATRLVPGYPLEIRPTGAWTGWAGAIDTAPDRRVAISSRLFVHKHSEIVLTYLHECAHQLLHEVDPKVAHGHDAAFFATNLWLFQRLDGSSSDERLQKRAGGWQNAMSLYDLQDPPPPLADRPPHEWQPRALAWALRTARELQSMDLDARACAGEIAVRYRTWCQDLEAVNAAKNQRQIEHQSADRDWVVWAGLGGGLVGVIAVVASLLSRVLQP